MYGTREQMADLSYLGLMRPDQEMAMAMAMQGNPTQGIFPANE